MQRTIGLTTLALWMAFTGIAPGNTVHPIWRLLLTATVANVLINTLLNTTGIW